MSLLLAYARVNTVPVALSPQAATLDAAPAVAAPTLRSILAGMLFATLLCAMNSYLTLSFGVIEEGPTIAALFFFALFFLSRTRITTTEMVLVSTMGSAGGSFGFIANFYAAKAMTGQAYTMTQMVLFGIASSLVGMVMVPLLRELLIRRDNLPWPGSRATESVIRTLVEAGDTRQPWYLLATFSVAVFYVIFNQEDGVGWFPAELALGGLVAYGGAVSLAPFALGGSYLMSLRTCVGFLAGALVLMVLAPGLPRPEAPQTFVWPGIGFLTSSGLTLILLNWRVTVEGFRSLLSFKVGEPDPERILSGRALLALAVGAFILTVVVLNQFFGVPLLLVVLLIAVGGLIQNIIATRAQAQTAFNPARVMGILLEGVCAIFGGRATAINLTGAGFVSGSGAQASVLTADMAYGRAFRVPPRWQFLTQFATILPSVLVSAAVFDWIAGQKTLSLDSADLAAPVAKVWATTSLVFDGSAPMPAGAMNALLVGAAVGVVYTLLERLPRLERLLPCSVGLGIGMVLPPAYGIAFFLGGFFFWVVLGRWLRVRDVTLTTVAVGCVVAEGIGGVTKALLATLGVL